MRALCIVAMVAAIMLASHRRADACTSDSGPPSPPRYPWAVELQFPTNSMWMPHGWKGWGIGGIPVELVVDEERSAQFLLTVSRPATPLAPGTVLLPMDESCAPPCSYCKSPCDGYQIVISEADVTPPSAPVITDVRTLLVKDPGGAGAYSCGDTDRLELTIDAGDDTTTERVNLGFGAYIAPTELELAAQTQFAAVFGYDPGPPGEETTSTIYLGDSVGRVRDGSPFLSAERFCFALVTFDRSGNVSERSPATCLDTNDETDPTVEWIESTACACSGGPRSGGGWIIGLAIVLCLRRRAK